MSVGGANLLAAHSDPTVGVQAEKGDVDVSSRSVLYRHGFVPFFITKKERLSSACTSGKKVMCHFLLGGRLWFAFSRKMFLCVSRHHTLTYHRLFAGCGLLWKFEGADNRCKRQPSCTAILSFSTTAAILSRACPGVLLVRLLRLILALHSMVATTGTAQNGYAGFRLR